MVTHSADETRAAGKELAARLQPGDVVLLEGPLGSGKTTFVQGIAEGLGAQAPATSPSFVIVNEYAIGGRGLGVGSRDAGGELRSRSPTPDTLHPTPFVLRHIDLYRLPDPTVDIDRIGFPELLNDPAAVTVVEWADRMPAEAFGEGGSAQRRIFRVRFGHGRSEGERTIDIE